MITLSLSAVCADDSPDAISGEVSGDVDIASANPGNTSGVLNYDIPADAKEIKSADLYVNVYSGSAQPTYGANANVTLKTVKGENQIASEELWIEQGSTDGVIYPVNNHTNKCYSDYQMHYDITDNLKDLNGTAITVKVNTFSMENKSFDGRIKLISLILAYDDGDDDVISYWADTTQRWTKTNTTSNFATKDVKGINGAELINIALSSADGSYKVNGEFLGDADNHTSGSFNYQYNKWDVSDKITKGSDTEVFSMYAGTSSYGSLKNVITLLKVSSGVEAEVSLATEYTSVNTCYAGTVNAITVKANSNRAGKYVIELLADGNVVNSTEIELNGINESSLLLTDPTVRNIDGKTENGANNTNVVYAVNVKYDGITIASANKTVPVLYNGNLGHDFEYGVKGFEEFAAVDFTGDIVIDIKDVSSYLAAAALNRTDVWNVQLTNGSNVSRAFVFIPYNWFNGNTYTENESMFNVTFNGKDIEAISYLRDQGNLGTYGKYGYGVFGYDVTDLIAVGNNTLVLNKNNPTPAVYPSVLVYMYDTEGSTTLKHASIINGADLLSNSYNNAGRIVKSDSQIAADLTNINNATLYVLAASAQKGESNIIVNGRQYTDVWDGTSSTTDLFTADITDIVSENNNVSFVATGSTILALPQIIVSAENIDTTLAVKALSTTYNSGKTFTVSVKNAEGKPVSGLKLALQVFTGKTSKTYYVTTNSKGVASFASASKLAIGTHKVLITSADAKIKVKQVASSIKVAKAKTTVKAPKVTAKVKKTKYFKVTVKNKATKKVVKGIKVKVKVYTGKKYKTFTAKTNSKGLAKINTKSLKVGKHKVVISSGNSKYTISAKSTITIKK